MYKPLPDSLTIKDSGIHGLGLFTKEVIPFGTVLGLIHFSFQGETIRTPLGAFGNHSDVPTCEKFQESFDADNELCPIATLFEPVVNASKEF